MSNNKLTEHQTDGAMHHISRLVTEAAAPDREGKRMSAEELKALAEDAAQAIASGAMSLSVWCMDYIPNGTQLTRLSLSPDEAGDIHVFSYQTETTLILPKHDVPLLIQALMRLKDN